MFATSLVSAALAAAPFSAAPITGHRAFYTMFSPMLDAPDWPSSYLPYKGGLVVMNPFNASVATVRRVQTTLSAATVVYFDSSDIQIATDGACVSESRICDAKQPWTKCASGAMPCCYSYNCDAFTAPTCPPDDFTAALARAFPARLSLRELPGPANNLTAPRPVCLYGKGPLFVHSEASVDALVPFLSGWVKERGYDGVYFDEYFASFDLSRFSSHFPAGTHFDCDGDGKPDTASEMAAQYEKYQKEFSARLRAALGPDAIMVANSGTGQSDPSLNGLTIEMCANEADCVASFEAQAKVAHKPLVAVMWLKGTGDECAIGARMRDRFPYLLEGTDFYDGTHVTCNDTLAL